MEDDEVLKGMLDQLVKSTAKASAAIDRALEFVAASNERIAQMEEEHRAGAPVTRQPLSAK